MRDGIVFSLRLWRLQSRQRRVLLNYDRKLKQARKERKTPLEEVQSIQRDREYADIEFDGKIGELWTPHLIALASKYHLPYPDREDWNEPTGPFFHRHLTREASVKLRSAIRAEQKERWE